MKFQNARMIFDRKIQKSQKRLVLGSHSNYYIYHYNTAITTGSCLTRRQSSSKEQT